MKASVAPSGACAGDLQDAAILGRRQFGIEAGEQEAAQACHGESDGEDDIARLDRELESRAIDMLEAAEQGRDEAGDDIRPLHRA